MRYASKSNRIRLQVRDGSCCHYCKRYKGKLTVDHKIPRSKGGSNDISNLVLACYDCNREKGSKDYDKYVKRLEVPKLSFSSLIG